MLYCEFGKTGKLLSGLALAGKRVITFSPNPFLYLRAYDQLRNAVSAMNLPVAVVANGMGLVNPEMGITHYYDRRLSTVFLASQYGAVYRDR